MDTSNTRQIDHRPSLSISLSSSPSILCQGHSQHTCISAVSLVELHHRAHYWDIKTPQRLILNFCCPTSETKTCCYSKWKEYCPFLRGQLHLTDWDCPAVTVLSASNSTNDIFNLYFWFSRLILIYVFSSHNAWIAVLLKWLSSNY